MSHTQTTLSSGSVGGNGFAGVFSALAAMFWGTSFEATHIALLELPPWTAAAGRFVFAAGAIVLFLAAAGKLSWATVTRNRIAFPVLGLVGVAGFNAALFFGMQTASPVTAALIMGTSPLTTNLLESVLQRRFPSGRAVLGMAISLVGVALTVGAFSGAHFATGDILILFGSLAWALYTIGCRRWVKESTPIETASWTMLAGAIALVAAAFLWETPIQSAGQASMTSWMAILWIALVGSVLAYLCWQVGIARQGPGATAVYFNLVPVSALIVAALFGQSPDVIQIAGVAVAIFGILLAGGRVFCPNRR